MAFTPKSVATYSKTCLQILCGSQSLLLDMLPHQLAALRWFHAAAHHVCDGRWRVGQRCKELGLPGDIRHTLPLKAQENREALGRDTLETMAHECLQLQIVWMPSLQRNQWMCEYTGEKEELLLALQQGGVHQLTGMNLRKGLVPGVTSHPARPQKKVASCSKMPCFTSDLP